MDRCFSRRNESLIGVIAAPLFRSLPSLALSRPGHDFWNRGVNLPFIRFAIGLVDPIGDEWNNLASERDQSPRYFVSYFIRKFIFNR